MRVREILQLTISAKISGSKLNKDQILLLSLRALINEGMLFDFRKVVALAPDDSTVLGVLIVAEGMSLFKYLAEGRQLDEKFAAPLHRIMSGYRKVYVKAPPQDAAAIFEIGGCFEMMMENFTQAEADLRRCVSLDPARENAWIALGWAVAKYSIMAKKQPTTEQREVVASVLLEGITVHESPYLRKAFGKTLFDLGRMDEAQRQFEIVQNVRPDDVYANLALAVVLIKKEENPARMIEAQNYLDKAGEILAKMDKTPDESKDGKGEKPLDKSARREYWAYCQAAQGVLGALIGNPKQAVERLQSALKLDPKNEVAQKALSLLESVRKNSPLAGK